MSLLAMTWAFSLTDTRLRPNAKLVLLAISDAVYEDQNYENAIKHETLAAKSNLSVDSAQRRVAELVALDLVFALKERRGPDGCRIANRYVVLCNEAAKEHARGLGWIEGAAREAAAATQVEKAEAEPIEAIQAADCGLDQAADCGLDERAIQAATATEPGRNGDVTKPHCCGLAYNESPNSTNINQLPSSPDSGIQPGEGRREEILRPTEPGLSEAERRLARWEAFLKRWRWDPLELPGDARLVFLGLGDDEQERALETCKRYQEICRERGKNSWHAKNWIAKEGWIAQGVEPGVKSPASVKVLAKSPEGRAWIAHHEARGAQGRFVLREFYEKRGFCFEKSLWPPRPSAQSPPRES